MTTKSTKTQCTHLYKQVVTLKDKPYYEKLKIIYQKRSEMTGKFEEKLNTATNLMEPDYNKPIYEDIVKPVIVDAAPGEHYSMLFCTKCGDTKEICVKSHGAEYTKAVKALDYEKAKAISVFSGR